MILIIFILKNMVNKTNYVKSITLVQRIFPHVKVLTGTTGLQLRTYQLYWGLLEFKCSGDRNKRDKYRDLLSHSHAHGWHSSWLS